MSDQQLGGTDLSRQLSTFEGVLQQSGLAPLAGASYPGGASRFVRWLVGDYRPRNARTVPG